MKIDPESLKGIPKDELIEKFILPLAEKISRYEEVYLTKEQVAKRFGKSLSFIDKCMSAGKLKPFKHDPKKPKSGVSFPLSAIVKYEEDRLK